MVNDIGATLDRWARAYQAAVQMSCLNLIDSEAGQISSCLRVEAALKADIARVEGKVDKLVPLEQRVAALEKRSA